MNPLRVLKAEWRRSRTGIIALALVIGLSVSIGLALSLLERGLRQGAARAGDDFDLLIGAPGSSVQLMLSAVYLQAQPLPLIDHALLQRLEATGDVQWAAPLAFGDRWREYPLVGTSETLVTLGGTRVLGEGRPFATPHEAVVGADVPLALHATFTPMHGSAALPEDAHEHAEAHFTVVGKLPRTGTPWDRAILVPLAAMWAAHDMHEGDAGAGLSALVVKPASIAAAYRLRAAWQTPATQAVFTGEVLTQLFATLGDIRTLMQVMAGLAQVVALGGVVLATLFAVALRRDTLSLLRTLGAPRAYLVLTVWSLTACVIVCGVLLGVVMALAVGHVATSLFSQATATVLPVRLAWPEWRAAGLFTLAGLLAALAPALAAYRREA